ncbi:unnamed protein product [Urochloa humidicola]
MVREAIVRDYEERFQEVVNCWTAVRGDWRSPIPSVTTLSSFRTDTDFGLRRRRGADGEGCAPASGYVQGVLAARGRRDVVRQCASVAAPQLAAALEADEPRVLRPPTAEYYLGLSLDSQVQRCLLR